MRVHTNQCTLRREVALSGVGLHTGANASVLIKPAPAASGICFRRVDLIGKPLIPARFDCVVDTSLATVVGIGNARVMTIEHLMAALNMAGVDNALIDVNGPEVPVLDGSAAPFCEALAQAGLKRQRVARTVLPVTREVIVRDGDAYLRACPAPCTQILYTIDFPHPLVGSQTMSFQPNGGGFRNDIAAARTFGFLNDVKQLQERGLALGGSLANALVFDDQGLLNQDGFRYSNECVRHKILDFLGDISLLPFLLVGRFEAYKAGHALHNRLLRKIAGTLVDGVYPVPAAAIAANSGRWPMNVPLGKLVSGGF